MSLFNMAREIKFRIWDGKEMITTDGRYFFDSYYGLVFSSQNNNVENDINLMQYTGLKDKNGKDIFEGDILDTQNIHVGKVLGEVSYQAPRYMYRAIGGKVDNIMFDLIASRRFVVIGNVHENPELLNN